MTKLYQVMKPGLMSTGWIGKYVCHFDGDYIILLLPHGKEMKYRKSSLRELSPREEDSSGEWIVVKEKSSRQERPKKYKQHSTEESARREAIRLAKANPGESFRYYKQCGRVEYKAVTTYELKETN